MTQTRKQQLTLFLILLFFVTLSACTTTPTPFIPSPDQTGEGTAYRFLLDGPGTATDNFTGGPNGTFIIDLTH